MRHLRVTSTLGWFRLLKAISASEEIKVFYYSRNKFVKIVLLVVAFGLMSHGAGWSRSEKPVLHGRHWVAITGKPLGATAGATIFAQGW